MSVTRAEVGHCPFCGLAQPPDGPEIHLQDCVEHDSDTCLACIEDGEDCDCDEEHD